MQVYEDDGTLRTLEQWEVEALEAARDAHDAKSGVVRQYAQAKAERILREAVVNSVDIPAEHACRMVALYPEWRAGESYAEGMRVRLYDKLYTVLQAHESRDGWEPDSAPSLFARVLPGQDGSPEADGGVAGEWVRPDSTNPYAKGDRVAHGGKVWVSLADGNVWEPGAAGSESLWEEARDE